MGYAAAEILGIDATKCLACGALARVDCPELREIKQAIRDLNPYIQRPGKVFEGTATTMDDRGGLTWNALADERGRKEFVSDILDGLEGKRVRITVEVLE